MYPKAPKRPQFSECRRVWQNRDVLETCRTMAGTPFCPSLSLPSTNHSGVGRHFINSAAWRVREEIQWLLICLPPWPKRTHCSFLSSRMHQILTPSWEEMPHTSTAPAPGQVSTWFSALGKAVPKPSTGPSDMGKPNKGIFTPLGFS